MIHGTATGYKRHRADGIPFPEEHGGVSCGCKTANRLAAYDYRARGDYVRIPCATCGVRRVIRDGRDGQCAECWQKAEHRRRQAEQMRYDRANESPPELVGGRWVNDHGIQRWHTDADNDNRRNTA